MTFLEALQTARLAEWIALAAGKVWGAMTSRQPAIFDCIWNFYDQDPEAGGTPVGDATIRRRWFRDSVRMEHTRRKDRDTEKEATRPYEATGTLRGNRLVLLWSAKNRPDILGSLVLLLNTDYDAMTGRTLYYSPMDKDVREYPIWFRKARVR